MARIEIKSKARVNRLRSNKKENASVQTRRSQRLAKRSPEKRELGGRRASKGAAGRGGKYEIGGLTRLETRESIHATNSNEKAPYVSIGSLDHMDSAQKKISMSAELGTSIAKRRPGKLYKKGTKGLKPTNRKPEQQLNPVFSLDQILCASNNKELAQQSELSTKYSKSEYSRLSRSDVSQSFRRTYIDVMNKVEHNLFENLKQGNILPKSSRKSELAKKVVVEHGNKVISFIKEVSQGQTGAGMEIEEAGDFGGDQADGCELSLEERNGHISDFKKLIGKLKEETARGVEIIDELLYRRTMPVIVAQQLVDAVAKRVPGFSFEHINLINTVYRDLYDVVYSGPTTHIRAIGIGSFDFDDMLKYRQLRSDKLSELLSNFLNSHVSDMTVKFERTLNPYHLSATALFAKTIKFLKVAKPEEEEQKPVESPQEPQISAFFVPEAEPAEKQSATPKRVVLDTKSQIADYVS